MAKSDSEKGSKNTDETNDGINDNHVNTAQVFGEVDIPRRVHSSDDTFSDLRILGGIYIGFAFDDRDDGELNWGIHVTDAYGLILSGVESLNLKKCKDEAERRELVTDTLVSMSQKWAETRRYKILGIALGLPEKKYDEFMKLGDCNPAYLATRKFWFSDLDATPFIIKITDDGDDLQDAASIANRKCFPGNIVKVSVEDKHNEVQIDVQSQCRIVNLPQYKEITHPEYWRAITEAAEKVNKRKLRLLFISSTAQGGGVALMRHAAIRVLKLLDVDAHWHIAKPNPAVFKITKRKFHNQLQGVTPADEKTRLTDKDKELWKKWNDDNFEQYLSADDGPVAKADLIIIDDPQLCGIMPKIRKLNPRARLIYRSHIEINEDLVKEDGSNAQHCWEFLYQFIKEADLFVSHPVSGFIPPNLDKSNVVLIPAATDPLDGLNKDLSKNTLSYYRTIFNRTACDQASPMLDANREYFVQVARFDPSKGISDCIKAYKEFRSLLSKAKHENPPHLVICGHSSVDDPDGSVVFQESIEQLEKEEFRDVAKDICLVRLPSSDQLLNSLLRSSIAVLQLSTREGFEIKVTEALAKSKVVIVYKAGGLPLQIVDKATGFVVPKGDFKQVGEIMSKLVLQPELRKKMEHTIANEEFQIKRQEFYTPVAIMHYLYFANELCWKDGEICKKWQNGKERGLEEKGVVWGNGEVQDMKARHAKDLWMEEYGVKLDGSGK